MPICLFLPARNGSAQRSQVLRVDLLGCSVKAPPGFGSYGKFHSHVRDRHSNRAWVAPDGIIETLSFSA